MSVIHVKDKMLAIGNGEIYCDLSRAVERVWSSICTLVKSFYPLLVEKKIETDLWEIISRNCAESSNA